MDPTKRHNSKLVQPQRVSLLASAALAVIFVQSMPDRAAADEGGVAFWLPGLFGSLSAVPQPQPGWAFRAIAESW